MIDVRPKHVVENQNKWQSDYCIFMCTFIALYYNYMPISVSQASIIEPDSDAEHS
jgi:hypothetical protein